MAFSDAERFQEIVGIVQEEFLKNNGVLLDSPVFERQDVLLGKYGEEADTKLIYKIEENGGEPLALRYDLTIPFVRYIKENGVRSMRRYAIGKVYRRDQPNISAGRYREFYQADFDIYGENMDPMVGETLLLTMAANVLQKLGIGYTILVNDVVNLRYIVQDVLGVPADLFKKFCCVIDKLDKVPFNALVGEFVGLVPDIDLEKLEGLLVSKEPLYGPSLENYRLLQAYANIWGCKDAIVFTNSLARGLDYYSGFIWEIKTDLSASTIVAGGRYDVLLGKPLLGISFGLSRIFSLLPPKVVGEGEANWKEKYYVTTLGNIPLVDKLTVVQKLQEKFQKPVVYSLTQKDTKLTKVINNCIVEGTRYIVIVAEDEWNTKKEVLVKDLAEKTQVAIGL